MTKKPKPNLLYACVYLDGMDGPTLGGLFYTEKAAKAWMKENCHLEVSLFTAIPGYTPEQITDEGDDL